MSKKTRAPLSVLSVDRKFVLAADCDDDRRNHTTREDVNPRHEAAAKIARRKGYARRRGDVGWCPAHTVSDRTANRRKMSWEECRTNEALPTPRFYPGAFAVGLLHDANDTWRVTAWGSDDTGFERAGLTEADARRVYAAIRDYTTINTLVGIHGFRHC